jgi:hypothetical protein
MVFIFYQYQEKIIAKGDSNIGKVAFEKPLRSWPCPIGADYKNNGDEEHDGNHYPFFAVHVLGECFG